MVGFHDRSRNRVAKLLVAGICMGLSLEYMQRQIKRPPTPIPIFPAVRCCHAHMTDVMERMEGGAFRGHAANSFTHVWGEPS